MKNEKSNSPVVSQNRNTLVKTPIVVAVVAGLHIVAITSFFGIQGCGTTRPTSQTVVEPAPAPVMPPPSNVTVKRPSLKPPRPAPKAPTSAALSSPKTYTVKKGDSLSVIAKRHKVSMRDLQDVNGLKNPNMIRVGQKLVLPAYAVGGSSATSSKSRKSTVNKAPKPSSKKPVQKVKVPSEGLTYEVVAGDALSKIAVKFSVKTADIRRANNLKDDRIYVGQKLVIPGTSGATPAVTKKKTAPSAPAPKKDSKPAERVLAPQEDTVETVTTVTEPLDEEVDTTIPMDSAFVYEVSAGEDLAAIGMTFGFSKDELMKANNMKADTPLKAGQKILIPNQ